ncbi:hypothetical protein M405DRAFT_819222 [Rhizopogon salebrosus TDB-379]|nr:hypothetical protein M405DRAFT_819222 [Rhizopogon salebrosus TDB-379]
MGRIRRAELVLLVTGSLSDDKLIHLTSAVGCILGPIAVAYGLLQATSTAARPMTVRREPTGHSTLTGTFILW